MSLVGTLFAAIVSSSSRGEDGTSVGMSSSLSKKNVCSVGFILFPVIAAYLTLFSNPPMKYDKAKEASGGWVPNVSTYHFFAEKTCIAWATLANPPTRDAMAS
jgi:MFS family permease